MENRLFGLSMIDFRRMSFQFAVRNDNKHPFNSELEMAGEDFVYGFLKRHKRISLRTPEATAAARAAGFNRVIVGNFFDLLGSLNDRFHFPPSRIYNNDETGGMTVPNKTSKVLSMKGKKQVGALASAERGTLVTAEICFNALGNYIPPLLVFPRKKVNPLFEIGTPPETVITCHPSGWMQSDMFADKWFNHFLRHAKPTVEDPVLLIFDGHATHTKNINLIEAARANHVHLLVIPPHTSHRIQPLDVSFMGPLSTYYEQQVRVWLRTHPGKVITIYQVEALFGAAYQRAATSTTAMTGFAKTGICPFNPDIFPNHMFAAAETTDRPIPVEVPGPANLVPPAPGPANVAPLAPGPANMAPPAPGPDNMAHPAPGSANEAPPAPGPANIAPPIPSLATMAPPAPGPDNKAPPTPDPANEAPPAPGPANIAPPIPSPATMAPPAPGPDNKAPPTPDPANNASLASGPSNNNPLDPDPFYNALSAPGPSNNAPANPVPSNNAPATPGPSNHTSPSPGPQNNTPPASNAPASRNNYLSPADIMGIPKVENTQPRRQDIRRGKTVILTSSPYMKELQSDQGRKRKKPVSKVQLFAASKAKKKSRGGGKAEKGKSVSVDSGTTVKNPACIYCSSRYSESKAGERWIMCDTCQKWAHEQCAGSDDGVNYTCELCME